MTDLELFDTLTALVEAGFEELVVTLEEYERIERKLYGWDIPKMGEVMRWEGARVVTLDYAKGRALYQQRFHDRGRELIEVTDGFPRKRPMLFHRSTEKPRPKPPPTGSHVKRPRPIGSTGRSWRSD